MYTLINKIEEIILISNNLNTYLCNYKEEYRLSIFLSIMELVDKTGNLEIDIYNYFHGEDNGM